MSVLQKYLNTTIMKKLFILLFGVILLSACNEAQKVSDDTNVYVIDGAYVDGKQVTIFFRDVEEPFEVPLAKCEEVPLVKGTIVLVDDDLNMSIIEARGMGDVFACLIVSMVFCGGFWLVTRP